MNETSSMSMHGCDELRKWLEQNRFRFAIDAFRHHGNECNWYAYRRSGLAARNCACNYDEPGMQIVVRPSAFDLNGARHESVEVELCGEFDGAWWKMIAYTLRPSELSLKLANVEAALIAAWNALSHNTAGAGDMQAGANGGGHE